MDSTTLNILLIIISYLVGSIPFTLILGKHFKGIDIREHGSGNLGGTNAIRVLGVKVGLPAGFLDVVKSFVMVLIASIIGTTISPLYFGLAASVGHVYPIFAKFKGGKAVSTTMGAFVAIHPIIAIVTAIISFGIIKLTKFVSIGSTIFGILMVLSLIIIDAPGELIPRVLLMLLVMYKHLGNYKRIFSGEEHKAKL